MYKTALKGVYPISSQRKRREKLNDQSISYADTYSQVSGGTKENSTVAEYRKPSRPENDER